MGQLLPWFLCSLDIPSWEFKFQPYAHDCRVLAPAQSRSSGLINTITGTFARSLRLLHIMCWKQNSLLAHPHPSHSHHPLTTSCKLFQSPYLPFPTPLPLNKYATIPLGSGSVHKTKTLSWYSFSIHWPFLNRIHQQVLALICPPANISQWTCVSPSPFLALLSRPIGT